MADPPREPTNPFLKAMLDGLAITLINVHRELDQQPNAATMKELIKEDVGLLISKLESDLGLKFTAMNEDMDTKFGRMERLVRDTAGGVARMNSTLLEHITINTVATRPASAEGTNEPASRSLADRLTALEQQVQKLTEPWSMLCDRLQVLENRAHLRHNYAEDLWPDFSQVGEAAKRSLEGNGAEGSESQELNGDGVRTADHEGDGASAKD